MSGRLKRAAAIILVCAVAVSGCGRGGSEPEVEQVDEKELGKPFDPPTRFSVKNASVLPEDTTESIAIYGTKAFVVTDVNITVLGTTNGELIGTVTPKTPITEGATLPGPPLLAGINGVPTMLVAMPVTLPGKGTAAPRPAVEVSGLDAKTGRRLWSVQVLLEQAESTIDSPLEIRVMGFSNNIAVLRAQGYSYGIDVITQKLVWKRGGFEAGAFASGSVVGFVEDESGAQRLAGLDASDGSVRWSDPSDSSDLNVQPAGPNFVLAYGNDRLSGDRFSRTIRGATGEIGEEVVLEQPGDITCHYDEAATTACSSTDWSAGFDATSGKLLWRLPDEDVNRLGVRVTTAWHGAVYGESENGPVVLNARTGADRESNPGIAPFVVSRYAGIALHPDLSNLQVFPAIG